MFSSTLPLSMLVKSTAKRWAADSAVALAWSICFRWIDCQDSTPSALNAAIITAAAATATVRSLRRDVGVGPGSAESSGVVSLLPDSDGVSTVSRLSSTASSNTIFALVHLNSFVVVMTTSGSFLLALLRRITSAASPARTAAAASRAGRAATERASSGHRTGSGSNSSPVASAPSARGGRIREAAPRCHHPEVAAHYARLVPTQTGLGWCSRCAGRAPDSSAGTGAAPADHSHSHIVDRCRRRPKHVGHE